MSVSESLKKERGQRIRELRENHLYMNRKAFALKHNIPYPTLQNWEDGRFGGLSKRGAKILATIFTQAGWHTSPEWLLDGHGSEPKAMSTIHLMITDDKTNGDDIISQELKTFYQYNADAVHAIVKDYSMQPRFIEGEYVAGIKYNGNDYSNIFNEDCIIHMKTGELFIRHLIGLADSDRIQISTLDKKEMQPLEIKEILYIAPILWSRREWSEK